MADRLPQAVVDRARRYSSRAFYYLGTGLLALGHTRCPMRLLRTKTLICFDTHWTACNIIGLSGGLIVAGIIAIVRWVI